MYMSFFIKRPFLFLYISYADLVAAFSIERSDEGAFILLRQSDVKRMRRMAATTNACATNETISNIFVCDA